MKFISKTILTVVILLISGCPQAAIAENLQNSYLRAVINLPSTIEVGKSTIFDASQSFIPHPGLDIRYDWDFGDGNKNEGVEALHAYQSTGEYTVKLKITEGETISETSFETFVYGKMIVLITDQIDSKDRIDIIENFAKKGGVYFKIIESYGSSTEFISEEVLTKKLNEQAQDLKNTKQIVVWTSENAGLNAISRYIQSTKKTPTDFSNKSIVILEHDIDSRISQAEHQFDLIKPEQIIITKEGSIDALIETSNTNSFIGIIRERGSEYKIINSESGNIRPWNVISYFVSALINNGIPDNTIALLLLLPIIATVVAFMRQVVGINTFGIYTPSIITLSFLIIGLNAGLLTLISAIAVGAISKLVLKKVRMLFIPKIAIIISLVSLTLLGVIITSIHLNFFNAEFLSIAIFPMLILSTLVEKFVSGKGEGNLSTTTMTMAETLLVALIAYIIAGGSVDLSIVEFRFEFVKRIILTYPELVLLTFVLNILLGKWTGLRLIERVRFREIFKHIEE